jgi:iron(III) transport system ATP-binding protein
MVNISINEVTKTFGEVIAVDDISIDIEEGELFTLLGPSGCGKTTLLRVIAGFYNPDHGQIFFGNDNVTKMPPHKRETGMVFQNYAIWPHMKVFDNVAFGLEIRKIPSEEIQKRVDAILEAVRLGGFGDRTPFQLSGGQQQRVALARALVINPKVLLLDEPLSNLDAKLRVEMRHELIRIQKEFGTTTVYVTHDQEEALSISDRVAVINQGRIMQVDNPRDIYTDPQNLFVADFIGSCTFIPGSVTSIDGTVISIKTPWGLPLTGRCPHTKLIFTKGDEVFCAIRPEDFKVQTPSSPHNEIPTKIFSVVFTGRYNQVYADVGGTQRVQAELDAESKLKKGDTLKLHVLHKDTIILPLKDDPFAPRIQELILGGAAAD